MWRVIHTRQRPLGDMWSVLDAPGLKDWASHDIQDVPPPPEELNIRVIQDGINRSWPRDQVTFDRNAALNVIQQAQAIANQGMRDLAPALSRYGSSGWGENLSNLNNAIARSLGQLNADVDTVKWSPTATVTIDGFKTHIWTTLENVILAVRALAYTKENDSFSWVPDSIYHIANALADAVGFLIDAVIAVPAAISTGFTILKYGAIAVVGFWVYTNFFQKGRR